MKAFIITRFDFTPQRGRLQFTDELRDTIAVLTSLPREVGYNMLQEAQAAVAVLTSLPREVGYNARW